MALVSKIFNALQKSRNLIAGALQKLINDNAGTENRDQLEASLLAADLGVKTVDDILGITKSRLKNNFINDIALYMENILHAEKNVEFSLPSVLMIVGVNGTGKTTTAAKLAHYYTQKRNKVILVAADTYRAAAVAQLNQWSQQLKIRLVCNEHSKDPSSVLFDGLQSARSEKADILIVDTAGRLHTYKNLMNELEKMGRVIKERFPEFHLHTYITIDSNLGQNSLLQAREFSKTMQLDGAILTKMDGTAKGGIVFALKQELNIPVLFLGVGEEINDLAVFNSKEYINSLLGLEFVEA